jgi:hypothetical protein
MAPAYAKLTLMTFVEVTAASEIGLSVGWPGTAARRAWLTTLKASRYVVNTWIWKRKA